jgi:hypothetical protein
MFNRSRAFTILLLTGLVHLPRVARTDPPGAHWAAPAAPRREGLAAVCDTRRNRMIVFGGYDRSSLYNDVWVTPLTGATDWRPLYISGSQPSARSGATAVYDSTLDRVLLFGGWTGATFPSYAYDVWSLSLSASPRWTRLTPSGTAPPGRMFPASAFDRAGNRLFVFGGFTDAGSFRDVWQLTLGGTPAWTEIRPPDPLPAARGGAGMIYDPDRDRLIIAGGAPGQGGGPGDTWELTLDGSPRWSLLVASGSVPSQVYGNPAIYDPVRRRMVLFDFFRGVELPLDDAAPVWASLPHQSAGDPIPGLRSSHALVFDPETERMFLHGGFVDRPTNDTWSYALAPGLTGWSRLAPASDPPSARAYHVAVRDPVRDRLIVYGGTDGGERHDLWTCALDTGAWAPLIASGTEPPAFRGLSAVYDSRRDRVIFFGGQGALGTSKELWTLTLWGTPTWRRIAAGGDSIPPRRDHSAVYDPEGDRMFVFGGIGSSGELRGDVWELDVGRNRWSHQLPDRTPRAGQSAVWDAARSRMLVFGGVVPASTRDLWSYVPATGEWRSLITAPSVPISARAYAVAVLDTIDDYLLITGGTSGISTISDVWAVNLTGVPGWTPLTVTGAPPRPWSGAVGAFDPVRQRIVVFGGIDEDHHYLDQVTQIVLNPDRPLVVRAGGPYRWRTGKPITFDAHRCYDFEINPLRFTFDFGDGATATGSTVSHTYASEGTYVLRLTGRDAGNVVTDSAQVIVDAIDPTLLERFDAAPVADGIEVRWRFHEIASAAVVTLERAVTSRGPWSATAGEARMDGDVSVALDRDAEPGRTYWYRLVVRDAGGATETFGPRSATIGARVDFGLDPIEPNPSPGRVLVRYRVAHAARVRVTVMDVSGREVVALVNRTHAPGAYSVAWDGRGDRGAVPAGIYLVRFTVPGASFSRRLVVTR